MSEQNRAVAQFILKHFWALGVVGALVNGYVMKRRSARHIAEKPELAEGYRGLIWGIVVWLGAPWVVMGALATFGGVPTVFHFFRLRGGNPYAIAWVASLFVTWEAGFYWLVARGGAKMIVMYPGIFNRDLKNPAIVKLIYITLLVAGIAAFVIFNVMDPPIEALTGQKGNWKRIDAPWL